MYNLNSLALQRIGNTSEKLDSFYNVNVIKIYATKTCPLENTLRGKVFFSYRRNIAIHISLYVFQSLIYFFCDVTKSIISVQTFTVYHSLEIVINVKCCILETEREI